jgi:hypothetical protein
LGRARIKPDEFANATNFHSDSAAIIESDLNHCVAAGWATPPRAAFVMDRVQPKWVDRFGGESSAEQSQTDRAAVAFFTTPNDAVFGPDFGQSNATGGARKIGIHCSTCSGSCLDCKALSFPQIRNSGPASLNARRFGLAAPA